MRVFIYEFVCAGGLGSAAPASLRREGWGMLHAVADDFARVPGMHVTTLVDAACPEPPGQVCQRVVGSEADAFRALAQQADATLVIAPEFDDLLLERSQWVVDSGGRLLGSLPAGVALTADKAAMAQHWQTHGVRTPPTVPAGSAPPTSLPPPWVCKPRFGAGSLATFLVESPPAWLSAFQQAVAEYAGEFIAQPFVAGTAASSAFLLGPHSAIPLLPATQQVTGEQRLQYHGGTLPLPFDLRDRAVRIGRAALAGVDGLQGYVGVDLVLGRAADGSEDHAIEINPRLTTSYLGLRQGCRRNLAQAWLDVLAGRDPALAWDDCVVHFTV